MIFCNCHTEEPVNYPSLKGEAEEIVQALC